MTAAVPVLLITGTVGAGKSTIAYELNDALSELEIPNAMVDPTLCALSGRRPRSGTRP